MKEKKPLVSFLIITYNQGKYIKDALLGGLSQEYSPIEIIISDDCSQDNTIQVIKETISKYKGNKKIVFNRNDKNIGLALNFNKALSMSMGDFIISSSGDDISHPNRTIRLINEWSKTGFKKHILFHSGRRDISPEGHFIREVLEPKYFELLNNPFAVIKEGAYAMGCTVAWPKTLNDYYGPMNSGINTEDAVFTFRAALLDGVVLIKESLIDYRLSVGIGARERSILPKTEKFHFKKSIMKSMLFRYKQNLNDLKKAKIQSPEIENILKKRITKYEILLSGYEKSFSKNLIYLLSFNFLEMPLKALTKSLLISILKDFNIKVIPKVLLR